MILLSGKSLPKGLTDWECEKGTLTVPPPIPFVPPFNLHEKRDTEQIKVKLPADGTNFQMSAFGQGNNKEYLVHVIAIKCLLEKMFKAVPEVRKQLELLLEAPKEGETRVKEGETRVDKDKQKRKLTAIKEELKTNHKFAGAETPKAYELFHCFVISVAQTQWDKIVQEMHTKDPWVAVNGQLHKGLCTQSWVSFQDCVELHKLTFFPADATEKQHFCMQQTIKKPQHVTMHQYMSLMGVLND